MNYYLARDGQTYGPYPQENFPSMLAAGQVVADDLVCPEGGSDWVPLSQVPGLAPTAAPAPAAATPAPVAAAAAPAASGAPRLRLGGGGAAHPASHAPAAATSPAAVAQSYPKANYTSSAPQQKTGLMEKAAGAWGALKIVGYAAIALIVVIVVVMRFVGGQRDKKEIAKLHSQPGWTAFNAANSQINSEATTVGYGNTSEMRVFAQKLAEGIEEMQAENFPPPKKSRYRGRSKLGRIASTASSVTSGLGSPQIHVEKRDSLIIALIHVPDFSRYGSSQRGELSEACFGVTQIGLAAMMKMTEQLSQQLNARANSLAATTPTNRLPRPPPGRPVPGARTPPPAAASAAPAAAPKPPKPPPEYTLVVGVRGKSAYEFCYTSKVSANTIGSLADLDKLTNEDINAPEPIKGNVPCHKELVKWFGDEKAAGGTPQ